MGDRVGVQLPVWVIYLGLTNHPSQLSLTIPPWVGAMSTGPRVAMLCGWDYHVLGALGTPGWWASWGRVTASQGWVHALIGAP